MRPLGSRLNEHNGFGALMTFVFYNLCRKHQRQVHVFPCSSLSNRSCSSQYPRSSHRYECLASNPVGTAKRTILLDVRADPPSVSHQPPAPLPVPPTQHQSLPSRQHSVSAMYGSTVFLHCPESFGSSRGTVWQLPSRAIVEHRHR